MKLIRKLVLGCVTVGFLATTLAATTYAWYKLGNAAFAESFEFNASTTEGFLVSIDGKNYKHKLSTEDMIKAMIYGKAPNYFEFDQDGNLVDLRNNRLKLEGNNLLTVYESAISMEPVTSKNGKVITNLSKTVVNDVNEYSSKYAYFNLYFKTVALTAEEKVSYNIYLDGLGYDDGHNSAPATSVWSNKATNVDLVANMTTYAKQYTKGEVVQVYTSNASRFSIQDLGYLNTKVYRVVKSDEEFDPETNYYEQIGDGTRANPNSYVSVDITEFDDTKQYYVIDEENTSIGNYSSSESNNDAKTFELSEDSQYDLGSFATDYKSTTDTRTDITVEQKQALDKLYNSNYNAMYTYYNNIKTEDTLENKLPHFNTDLPQTIRSLTTFDENGVKINTKEVIATVKSGEVTKVAFRFWIEGWDGDCFDGLPGYLDEDGSAKEVNPINCRLLFNSIKVD